MQPDVGQEVLWVIRECISGEILKSKNVVVSYAVRLSGTAQRGEIRFKSANCGGRQRWTTLYSQRSRNGIARSRTWLVSFPRFSRKRRNQFMKRTAMPKKNSKSRCGECERLSDLLRIQMRRSRPVVQDYCQAVRAALSEDGRPRLDAPGLTLQQRLCAIDQSLERMGKKGHCLSRW